MIWVPLTYLLMSTVSPGPVTVMTVQHSTRYGRFAGAAVALGGATTTAVFLLLALLLTDEALTTVPLAVAHRYQQAGAILLLLMGLLAGYKSLGSKDRNQAETISPKHYAHSYFTGLLLMTPFFPQAILFYTVILPHYAGTIELNQSIVAMGTLKILLTLTWYSLLANAACTIRDWFFRPRTQRALEMAASVFLIGTSLTMLW